MAEQTSCIVHPPKNHLAILRADYLRLCEGDLCAAILLNAFEYWTNLYLSAHPEEEPWVRRSQTQLAKEDLQGLFERKKVGRGVQALLDWGYLISRRDESSTDRTQEYLLMISSVQAAILDAYPILSNVLSRDNAKSPAGTMQSPLKDNAETSGFRPENRPETAPLSKVPQGTMESPFRDFVYNIDSPEDPEEILSPPTPSPGEERENAALPDPDPEPEPPPLPPQDRSYKEPPSGNGNKPWAAATDLAALQRGQALSEDPQAQDEYQERFSLFAGKCDEYTARDIARAYSLHDCKAIIAQAAGHDRERRNGNTRLCSGAVVFRSARQAGDPRGLTIDYSYLEELEEEEPPRRYPTADELYPDLTPEQRAASDRTAKEVMARVRGVLAQRQKEGPHV